MMMNEASNLILGPNGVAAGNFAVAGEVGSYVGLLNINFSNTNSNVSIETDGFTSDVTFISNGGVNGAITLNAKGITLNGNITNLKAIDLNSNNLTFGGNNIQLLANGSAITFRANEQLTLTSASDIEINSNIAVTNDQQGSIDASGLASGQGLVIKGDIGNYSTSVRLGQFNIGSSATDFNAGNAAIGNLIFGNDGIVLFAHNNYLITKTTNASGQGTIIFRPVVADNTNLVAGTNLGSADNPLAEINFAAPAGTNTDTILNVGQGVNLYATEITTAGVNTGSFNFNGGGTSIVSGTVGTAANKFNNITLTNNTTVKFTDDVISNGATTIGGNSTLQIANDYITDSIQGNAAGDTGTLQFVNTKGILVTLKGNPNPDNALAALQVSGSADVAIDGSVNINGEINLGANVLGFTDGISTWGNDTTISTTLTSDEVMGNIVISGAAEVKIAGLKTIKVQDNASIDFIGTKTYTLIQGDISADNGIDPNVVGTNRYVIYGLSGNTEALVIRTIDINNIENILNNDISGNGNPVIRHNLVTFLNPNNTGNAEQAYNNILLAQNTNDAATSFAATLTDTSTSVNNININVAKEEQGLIGYRLDELRYLCNPESDKMASSEGGVAAGDEPIDNVAYGVWFKPLYVDTHQSEKGGVAGYKAKTVGTVIGLDTLANDNLMIGAAIGLAKTDVKHQNYKRGDKTTIDSLSFSLYGAQQLVANFFVHGNAILSVNQVKNRSQRYVFDKNGNRSTQIASANYSNMTFGGNFMVGYDASLMDGLLVTPMAGLSYLKSSDESYKESSTTFANRQVYSKFSDRTDFIGGAKLMGYTINLADLIVYPEAHAFVIQKIGGRLSKTQYQLEGQVNPYITPSDKTARTTYNLGLSGTIRPDTKMEYGIGYDLNIAKKFISHQGTVKVRLNF